MKSGHTESNKVVGKHTLTPNIMRFVIKSNYLF
jgi:hypothetical protein